MIQRGQIQLRGLVRWRLKRFSTRQEYGSAQMDRLPIVFGNAIPKNGSKLLYNVLRGLAFVGPFVDTGLNPIKPYFNNAPTDPGWIESQLKMLRSGDMRFGYLYATDENITLLSKPNWANFIIIRDPRDAIVSEVYYALDLHPDHLLHHYLDSLGTMEARINALINGIPEGELARVNVRNHYERFLPWLELASVYIVRFEDLVNDRKATIGGILKRMQGYGFTPQISDEEAVIALENQMAPGKSDTFRKGKTGEWKKLFTEQNKRVFKQVAGDLLVQLGYEDSGDW